MYKPLLAALLATSLFSQKTRAKDLHPPTLEGTIIEETLTTQGVPVYSFTLRKNTGEPVYINLYTCPEQADQFLKLNDYIKISTDELAPIPHINLTKPVLFWKYISNNKSFPFTCTSAPKPPEPPKKEKKEQYDLRGRPSALA